jgi:hypothetical protein
MYPYPCCLEVQPTETVVEKDHNQGSSNLGAWCEAEGEGGREIL